MPVRQLPRSPRVEDTKRRLRSTRGKPVQPLPELIPYTPKVHVWWTFTSSEDLESLPTRARWRLPLEF